LASCSVKNKDTEVKFRYPQWRVRLHLSPSFKLHYTEMHFARLTLTMEKVEHTNVSNSITTVSTEVFKM
jgi:hypothetical protein